MDPLDGRSERARRTHGAVQQNEAGGKSIVASDGSALNESARRAAKSRRMPPRVYTRKVQKRITRSSRGRIAPVRRTGTCESPSRPGMASGSPRCKTKKSAPAWRAAESAGCRLGAEEQWQSASRKAALLSTTATAGTLSRRSRSEAPVSRTAQQHRVWQQDVSASWSGPPQVQTCFPEDAFAVQAQATCGKPLHTVSGIIPQTSSTWRSFRQEYIT